MGRRPRRPENERNGQLVGKEKGLTKVPLLSLISARAETIRPGSSGEGGMEGVGHRPARNRSIEEMGREKRGAFQLA